jgi:hypothetical protein
MIICLANSKLEECKNFVFFEFICSSVWKEQYCVKNAEKIIPIKK